MHGVAPSVEVLDLLSHVETRPDLVLDVGANRGQFVILVKSIWPSVSIVCFEPGPAITVLRKTARLFEHGEVDVREIAASDAASSRTLLVGRGDDNSTLHQPLDVHTELNREAEIVGRRRISTARLDRENLPGFRAGLLKIDVQGHELEVLRGTAELLESIRYVLVELSEDVLFEGQRSSSEIRGLLENAGFREVAAGPVVNRQRDILFSRGAE